MVEASGSSPPPAAAASSFSPSPTAKERTISSPLGPNPAPPRAARLAQILLVEDSPADIELTRQTLAEAQVANEVHVVQDGQAAIDFVRGDGAYAAAPRPDLILLDLNLPKKNGREVLVELKNDPDLRTIPVVMLTTSASEEDLLRAYQHHVNSYIRKPVRLAQFIDVLHEIDQYWLAIVSLPPQPEQ